MVILRSSGQGSKEPTTLAIASFITGLPAPLIQNYLHVTHKKDNLKIYFMAGIFCSIKYKLINQQHLKRKTKG